MSAVPGAMPPTSDFALVIPQREIDVVRRILFFDGVCGICNWSVDFVLRRDINDEFQFSPLQGDTAKSLLGPEVVNDLNTVVLFTDGRTYRKSAAVVRVLWRLSPVWQFVGLLLWLIPLPLRDLGYTLVAAYRYRLFGKKETCRLPTPQERSKFLP